MKTGPTQRRLSSAVQLLAVAAAMLLAPPSAGAAATAKEKTENVEKKEKGTLTIELKGLLIPLDTANLSARSTGVITAIKKEGDLVRSGEIVVHLEDDLERLAVESEQSVYDKRKYEADSNEKLAAKGGVSEDNLRTARTNLRTAEIQLKQAKVAQEHKGVVAPFDGIVTHLFRHVGEGVDQYNMQLVTMVNLSKVYLETYLPANRLKDVQAGQPVEVRVADLPGQTFTGTVDFVAPVIDPASGEFRMKILIPNDDRSLRSGMSAVGRFTLPESGSDANPGAIVPQ